MNIEHDDEEEKIPEVTPETIIEDEEPPAYQPAEGLPYRPELSNLSKMYQTWFLDYASYVILYPISMTGSSLCSAVSSTTSSGWIAASSSR